MACHLLEKMFNSKIKNNHSLHSQLQSPKIHFLKTLPRLFAFYHLDDDNIQMKNIQSLIKKKHPNKQRQVEILIATSMKIEFSVTENLKQTKLSMFQFNQAY